MNRTVFTLIVSILLFLIVITIGYLISFQNNAQGVEVLTPTPMVSTPTPAPTQVIGTIEEIGEKVEYKNATILRVNGQTVYLSDQTRVIDFANNVDPETLVVGQAVVVEGNPVEGGLDAVQVTVVARATPSPSRPSSAAPVSSPSATPAI